MLFLLIYNERGDTRDSNDDSNDLNDDFLRELDGDLVISLKQ